MYDKMIADAPVPMILYNYCPVGMLVLIITVIVHVCMEPIIYCIYICVRRQPCGYTDHLVTLGRPLLALGLISAAWKNPLNPDNGVLVYTKQNSHVVHLSVNTTGHGPCPNWRAQ